MLQLAHRGGASPVRQLWLEEWAIKDRSIAVFSSVDAQVVDVDT